MKTVLALLLLLSSLLLSPLLPLAANAAEPAPLGRLFFTPEQRVQLDGLRTKKVVATQTKEEPPPENVTYSGIVQRGDGKTTVWVNSKALSERDIRDSASLVGRIERDGRILVQPAQGTAASLRLKVGQSAELLSGKVEEKFARPPAPDAPAPGAITTASKPTAPVKAEPDVKQPRAEDKDFKEPAKSAPIDPAAANKQRASTQAAR